MTIAIVGLQLQAGKYQIAATWSGVGAFPPGYNWQGFQVEYSKSSDMSGSTLRFADGGFFTFQAETATTYYVRVRSSAQYRSGGVTTFIHGDWSDIVSATETSDPADPWSTSWVQTTPLTVTFGSGSGIVGAGWARTKQNGLVVFFNLVFSGLILSSPSGFFRVGNMPLPLRSGGGPPVTGMRAYTDGQKLIVGKVVDAGGDEAAVELSMYDGSFAAAASTAQYFISGFYETTV